MESRSVLFENVEPYEKPEEKWRDISEKEGPTLRACLKLGLLAETFSNWQETDYGVRVLDGGDFIVTLTGAGVERLIRADEPVKQKAFRQISENVPVIITSVLGALLLSYLLRLLGWTQ